MPLPAVVTMSVVAPPLLAFVIGGPGSGLRVITPAIAELAAVNPLASKPPASKPMKLGAELGEIVAAPDPIATAGLVPEISADCSR